MVVKRKRLLQEWGIGYAFVLPAVALVCVFLVYPLIRSIYLSFFSWNGISAPKFIGLVNYVKLFHGKEIWNAFLHTILYTVCSVTGTVLVGLLIALAIERRIRGWRFYKFALYISVMLPVTVVAVLFAKFFEPNYGLFNALLRSIGLERFTQNWLGDPKTALGSIIAVSVWQYSGFTMLLLLAAMESIDPAVHEAATIDGINERQRIFYITLPCIKRPLFVVVMLQIIFSFKTFDIFWIMTGGGPALKTEVLTTMLYRTAFSYGKYGLASAISVVMILIISLISLYYLKKSKLGEQVVE